MTKVFISYNHLDQLLVSRIATQLRLPAGALVEVFTDRDLPAGREFSPVLSGNIGEADWFLLIYTQGEKRYEYCMFEAGQYFNNHHLKDDADPISDRHAAPGRFCCLYDTPDIPAVFGSYQSYQIFSFNSDLGFRFRQINSIKDEADFYERVPLQRFLKDFFGSPRQSPVRPTYAQDDDRDLRVQIAKAISEAFDANSFDKVVK